MSTLGAQFHLNRVRPYVEAVLLVLSISGSAFASAEFPFDVRVQVELRTNALCADLAAATLEKGVDVGQRQARFNKMYGPGVLAQSDPDFVPFLVFMDVVSGVDRQNSILAALNKINEGEINEAIAALTELDTDTKLISKYFEVLKVRLPKMAEAFDDTIKFTALMSKRWNKEIKKIQELQHPVGSVERAAYVTEAIGNVQGARTKLEGFYTEFQLSLRMKNVESAGFYLAELLIGHKNPTKEELKEKIQFLVTTVPDLLGLVKDGIVKADPNNPNADTILEATAQMLLTKEFDLRTRGRTSGGIRSETWFEPKNYDAPLKGFGSSRSRSLRKQVHVGFVVRKIMMRLNPDLRIYFEFHFLNGIEKRTKERFEQLFVELKEVDATVIGEVPDSP